jgi:hypothetical protein
MCNEHEFETNGRSTPASRPVRLYICRRNRWPVISSAGGCGAVIYFRTATAGTLEHRLASRYSPHRVETIAWRASLLRALSGPPFTVLRLTSDPISVLVEIERVGSRDRNYACKVPAVNVHSRECRWHRTRSRVHDFGCDRGYRSPRHNQERGETCDRHEGLRRGWKHVHDGRCASRHDGCGLQLLRPCRDCR